MKQSLPAHDWPVIALTCLAFGGLGSVVIFCFLIGFGFNTFVGKEALYICFALQTLNLSVIRIRERRLHQGAAPQPSRQMRRFRQIFSWCWRVSAVLLLVSLAAALLGRPYGSFWVRYPCLIGAIFAPIGWFGCLIAFHRRRQAGLYAQNQQK